MFRSSIVFLPFAMSFVMYAFHICSKICIDRVFLTFPISQIGAFEKLSGIEIFTLLIE